MEYVLQPLGLIWATGWVMGIRCLWLRRWSGAGWAIGLSLFLQLIGATPFSAWLVAGLERPFVASTRAAGGVRADAVVMLGGTHSGTGVGWIPFNLGEPGDRVLTSLELIRLGRAPNLVLGGSLYERNGQRRPDGELLQVWMEAWRLPTGKLHLLGMCANTRDEAERTAALARRMGWRRILLVSTASHLRRGEAVFRRAGLEVHPVGCEFIGLDRMAAKSRWTLIPRIDGFQLWNTWFHEQVGWYYYRLKGWA
jgi:uncharacterized SAM-binding protein YcdF (DUF218 family)